MTGAPLYLGVDGGATRCRARLRDADGKALAEASGAAANIHVDFAAAVAVLAPSLFFPLLAALGACAVALLAAVDQGLGTCLHMIAKPSMQARVKELLKVPEQWVPVWLQLVGYSAEGTEAGGQRPRHDFETLFFEGSGQTPFRRDPEVVRRMEQAKLLQPAAPLPGRFEELRFLARMYGYPEDGVG